MFLARTKAGEELFQKKDTANEETNEKMLSYIEQDELDAHAPETIKD